MMRAYNSNLIPKIETITDRYYISDLESISPASYLTDKQIRQTIKTHRGKNDVYLVEVLIESFGRYVISIAKNYQGQGLSLSDLISEGMLGLLKSIERFDLSNKTKFVTYSNIVISRYMREALDYTNNIVKLPKNIRNERMKTRELVKVMQMKGKGEKDILDAVDPANVYLYFNPDIYSKKSLSDNIGVNLNISMGDTLLSTENSPDYKLNTLDLKIQVNNLLKSKLTKNERKVIRMFFGMGRTYPIISFKEIAKKLNLSKADVKILKESGLEKLKDKDSLEILTQFRHI